MQLNEYQVLAHKTANPNLDRNTALLVAALGLVDEAIELYASTTLSGSKKELGDLAWYACELCTLLGWRVEEDVMDVFPYRVSGGWGHRVSMLLVDVHYVGEYIKKVIGHGHIENDAYVKERLAVVLHQMYSLCHWEWTVEEVLQANIDKLRARYGEAWSSERSINRVPEDV